MKHLVIAAAGLLALSSTALQVKAQQVPVVATAAIAARSPEQLDQLLGPVALYPDPLIAQILPAATLPSQLVMASRYVQQGMSLEVIDQQPWDPSVKALTRYPDLLRWMDTNLAWTSDVGQTYTYQQVDVMNAIQRLRYQAMSMGNLQSTPQQTVYNNNGIVEVVPANPQIIYVPVYQPTVVYTQPARTGVHISFGLGVTIGGWLNHDLDWRDHRVVEWRRDNPRPSNWWYRQPNERQHVTVVNNTTVINNRNNGRDGGNWPTHREPAPAPVVHNPRVETRTVHTPQPPPNSRPTRQPQQAPRWAGNERNRDGHGGRPSASVGNVRSVANRVAPAQKQIISHPTAANGGHDRKPGRVS
ncbi:MAG: hypothetical protein JWM16_898 [Verrucomicrobiales bacterium]|nr:hypothetical protein [Verrucomicrobiales bacterium]